MTQVRGDVAVNPVPGSLPTRRERSRPRQGVPLLRSARTLPTILSPDQVDALTSALRTDRDRAMVAAMVLGGLRRCQVPGLRMRDLRPGERRVFVAEGKGGHQRLIPVSGRFFATVKDYLDVERPPTAPLALAIWDEIEAPAPVLAATMRRYLQQIACSLRPGSVTGVELGLRSFAGFLLEAHPDVTTVAAVIRAHIEAHKPWLAARPGQRVPRLTVNTRAHRLGTLRVFFLRLAEWGGTTGPSTSRSCSATCPARTSRCPRRSTTPSGTIMERCSPAGGG